jgi:DNA-binding MarR family transcriptional regulator
MSQEIQLSRLSKHELIEALGQEIRIYQTAVDLLDEAAADSMGINRTDGRCVDVIEREGPITAGRLASLAGLTTGAVTAVVDRLEAKGLVRRRRDADDRRRVLIEATEETLRRSQEIYGPLYEVGIRLLSRYSNEELRAMLEMLRRSRDAVEQRAATVRAETPAR